jgi:hypothetical protein
MSAAWKQFVREVARLMGGRGYWANAGERLDVWSASVVAKRLSLETLTQLAEQVEREATLRRKAGLVAVKVRVPGRPRLVLLVMTAAVGPRVVGSHSTVPRDDCFATLTTGGASESVDFPGSKAPSQLCDGLQAAERESTPHRRLAASAGDRRAPSRGRT